MWFPAAMGRRSSALPMMRLSMRRWAFLDWKEPIDGGKPAAYKIQRRERSAGDWQDVSTAMDSEMTLVDQPRGKELEYRAVAVNKAGDGEPSNTVLAVL